MLEISHAEASAAILRHVAEGRLTQDEWHDEEDGREIACLLGAIHPSIEEVGDCSGDLMPLWLAGLVPMLFGGLPVERIYPQAERFGKAVARWHVLTESQWERVLARFRVHIIDEAVEAARPVAKGEDYWPRVESACREYRAAIESPAANAAAWAAEDAAADAARAALLDRLFTYLLDLIEAECGA